MPGFPSIQEIAQFLETWAPAESAQSYDNVGLQVGDPKAEVRLGLIALDMTADVLEEARALSASLIITHHPLIFQPLKRVTTQSLTSGLALGLASSGIALYSIHTNLDAASGGVSFALGRQLGLHDLEFLDTFESNGGLVGLGAIGRAPSPYPLAEFLNHVASRLNTPSLRYVGDASGIIERVAVCGGSGADFIERAVAAGADAYVTSDVKYHAFFDVLDTRGRPRIAFIDAGHYETEAVTESLLKDELAVHFPDVDWRRTETRTSPVQTFLRRP